MEDSGICASRVRIIGVKWAYLILARRWRVSSGHGSSAGQRRGRNNVAAAVLAACWRPARADAVLPRASSASVLLPHHPRSGLCCTRHIVLLPRAALARFTCACLLRQRLCYIRRASRMHARSVYYLVFPLRFGFVLVLRLVLVLLRCCTAAAGACTSRMVCCLYAFAFRSQIFRGSVTV